MSKIIDMHIHSSCSDGTDSVEELFAKIKEKGIEIFSLTDHDTVEGNAKMAELAEKEGLRFVPGIELSCLIDLDDPDSDCHILGYGCDPNHEAFQAVVEKNAFYRRNKLPKILKYLKDMYDLQLSTEAVKRLEAMEYFGKPYLADELRKAKICETNQEAFDKYLDDYKSADHITAREAIQAIIASGGVAVWAHPIGDKEDCKTHDTGEKYQRQLKELLSYGIQGLECCYSRYPEEEIEFLLASAAEHDLLISGGSDYHGSKKNVELAQTGLTAAHRDEITLILSL